MIKRMEILGCAAQGSEKCGCVAEVLCDCDGQCCELSCGGQPMAKLEAKTADQGKEKHVPVVEKIAGGYRVKVGDIPHPMEADHWIQMIELRTDKAVYRKYLDPGMAPEATFMVADLGGSDLVVYEYCNKHGLWSGK